MVGLKGVDWARSPPVSLPLTGLGIGTANDFFGHRCFAHSTAVPRLSRAIPKNEPWRLQRTVKIRCGLKRYSCLQRLPEESPVCRTTAAELPVTIGGRSMSIPMDGAEIEPWPKTRRWPRPAVTSLPGHSRASRVSEAWWLLCGNAPHFAVDWKDCGDVPVSVAIETSYEGFPLSALRHTG